MAASSTETDSKACPFLELPAEMRNRIYEYALCEDDKIIIDTTNYQQPALLKTNRQVRQEASSIYYSDNGFLMECPDFDASALITFFKHSKAFLDATKYPSQKKRNVGISINSRSWSNLLRWVKAWYVDGVPKVTFISEEKYISALVLPWNVAAGAFAIAMELEGMKWEKIERVLLQYKESHQHSMGWTD